MLTILTPCSRPENLPKLFNSIQFDKIDKWIIIYDTSKSRSYTYKYKGDPKIIEVECDTVGSAGHPQRNYGMYFVEDGFLYFLDDDTIIHPDFWSILPNLNSNEIKFYTFDQARDKSGKILTGNSIVVDYIDTAMYVVHKSMIRDIRWHENRYDADGYFIVDVNTKNPGCHVYIKKILCYYNYLK